MGLQIALLAIPLIGLIGCSQPTQTASTWHAHGAAGRPFGKILVVGVTENSNQRRRFENAMVSVLEGGSSVAWASHELMPSNEPLNRDSVGKIVESTGADAVLATRLVSHEVAGEQVDARTGVKTNPQGQSVTNFFRYDYDEFEEAAYLVVKSTVTLTTEIYETSEGELVYSVDTTTYEKESEFEIIDEATRAIAERLRQDRVTR
jgi:hypothetical protein